MSEAQTAAPPPGGRDRKPKRGRSLQASPEPAASRARRGYFLPGVIALAALLALGAAFGAGDLSHSGPSTLAGADVAEQLALAMQAQAASSSPPRVSCPASEPVRPGLVFYCTVAPWRGAGRRDLRVTEVGFSGRLSWAVVPAPGAAEEHVGSARSAAAGSRIGPSPVALD